jgi:hypothetical protein
MNSNRNILDIGDTRVLKYQKTIIIIGAISLLLFSSIAIVSENKYYKYFPMIVLLFFIIILLIYSKIYSINCDLKYFYIRNLFSKKTIKKEKFVEIRKVPYLDFLQIVVFKDISFLILRTSESFFNNIFKPTDIVAKELTTKVKEYIDND